MDFRYSPEERLVRSFVLPLHNRKASLTCSIFEEWEEQLSHTAKCAELYTHTITDRSGVTSLERADLETTITGSLGLKGIAEFKGEVKSKIGLELRLDESREEKREFRFSAPECGRLTILLYQLKRKYRLLYEDSRFFHKDRWTKTFTEWTNKIYNASKRSYNDPDCGCNPKPSVGFDGLAHLITNKFIMLLGYKYDGTNVSFPELDKSIQAKSVNEVMFRNFIISSEQVPSYMLFLTQERSTHINGTFVPYDEERASAVDDEAKFEGQSSMTAPKEMLAGESNFDMDTPYSFNLLAIRLARIASANLDSYQEAAELSSASGESDEQE